VGEVRGNGTEQDPKHRSVAPGAGDKKVGVDLLTGRDNRRPGDALQGAAGGSKSLVDRLHSPGDDRPRLRVDGGGVAARARNRGRRRGDRVDGDRGSGGKRKRFGSMEGRFRFGRVVVGDGNRPQGGAALSIRSGRRATSGRPRATTTRSSNRMAVGSSPRTFDSPTLGATSGTGAGGRNPGPLGQEMRTKGPGNGPFSWSSRSRGAASLAGSRCFAGHSGSSLG
jgi:hypothetical protein